MKTISFLVVLSCAGLTLGDWGQLLQPKKFDACKEYAVGFNGLGLFVPLLGREEYGAPNSTITFAGGPIVGGVPLPSDGVFRCRCRGTYQFTFTAPSTVKLCLKSRYPVDNEWDKQACGQQHTVLKYVHAGEEVAVYVESGNLLDADRDSFGFTGFLVYPD
ncbi:uncharacterized protein LOC113202514 [Frankliniella occidentalis]|uniref:Uncharacterized protein LOC113202514 n=1 Tax=Frankliniella occidentalis TaxID=133901 RepID=A0A6J1RW23_FRAOC|nr:uncharacterized protein LOC113202514 [Frankliniella occidentalis]